MKPSRYIHILVVALVSLHASAQSIDIEASNAATGVSVTDPKMVREAGLMTVTFNMDLASLKVSSNRAAVFTPVIVRGSESQPLPPVGIYGRTRWYQYMNGGDQPFGGEGETTYRYSQRPNVLAYSQTIPYEDWMDGAHLELRRDDYNCCHRQRKGSGRGSGIPLASYKTPVFSPLFHFARPTAEKKHYELAARAYIAYQQAKVEIVPTYRDNPKELGRIIASIDSLRADNDITVQSLHIKGYASPEGTYASNERLAKGRTEALKQYVLNLYHFDKDFITTDYEAEDWEGLRALVAQSTLQHKSEILDLIADQTLDADTREQRIQDRYPDDYQFMVEHFYPTLRYSEYRIVYSVRPYLSVDEIRSIMDTAPQKLSLDEFYLLAQTYEAGSREFNEVFETAVRLFPRDPVANLNAANTAMSRRDYDAAERYLAKAGQGAHATYARGMLKGLQGDYAGAEALVHQAVDEGMEGVDDMIFYLRKLASAGSMTRNNPE